MTIEELYSEIENSETREDYYIVAIKYKYDFEEEYTIENQLLEVDYDSTAHIPDVVFTWGYDWNEGQTDIEVLGYVPVRKVQVIFTSVLDKIRAEIEARLCDVVSDYTDGYRTAIQGVLTILDKYKAEGDKE